MRSAAALLLVGLAACGGAPAAPAMPDPPKPSHVPMVKLLDAGKTPRRVLRYETDRPAPFAFTFETHASSPRKTGPATEDLWGKGQASAPTRAPDGDSTLEIRLSEVHGSTHEPAYEMDQSPRQALPGIPPPPIRPVDASWALSSSLVGRLQFSGPGFLSEATLAPEAGALREERSAQRADALLHLMIFWTVPVPEEAVGLGATWAITGPLDLSDFAASLGAVARLESLDPMTAVVHVRGTLAAERQVPRAPIREDGARRPWSNAFELLGLEGTLEGDWHVDEARILGTAKWTTSVKAQVRFKQGPDGTPKDARSSGESRMERTIR